MIEQYGLATLHVNSGGGIPLAFNLQYGSFDP